MERVEPGSIQALVWVTAMLVVGIIRGNTPPPWAEVMERVVGEIENGLASRMGLGVLLLLLELLLSSSMVKLVLGEGERCLGEREGERRARNPGAPQGEWEEGEVAE